MGIFGPPLVTRKLPCGTSCQMGLWCNLLAEPLPELWVPLGVGKLPFVTSLPTVVPPGVQDTPPGPAASPTGSSTWGTGEEGGALPGAPPYTVAVTLPLLSSFLTTPRGLLWDPGLHCYHHVPQEAQRLLWGLWMVGDGRATAEMRVDLEHGSCWVARLRGSGCARDLGLWGALSVAR